jgi:hypothetical protein
MSLSKDCNYFLNLKIITPPSIPLLKRVELMVNKNIFGTKLGRVLSLRIKPPPINEGATIQKKEVSNEKVNRFNHSHLIPIFTSGGVCSTPDQHSQRSEGCSGDHLQFKCGPGEGHPDD